MFDVALHSIELCAGVGMLGEGLRAGLEFLGVDHRADLRAQFKEARMALGVV